uniref:Carbohydrate kinase PfkB domain-containing protein n=1 Tax=Brassica oleracea var. oleracea TaxID=109376 RepID=A0A0D3DJ35_BRAOL
MSSTREKGLIVSFGEMLIDLVPTESGVSLAESPGFLKAPGGAPANVAIAVTRLGGRSAFVGGQLRQGSEDRTRFRHVAFRRRKRVYVLPEPECRHASSARRT